MIRLDREEMSKNLCLLSILALPFSWFTSPVGSVYRLLMIIFILLNIVNSKWKIQIYEENKWLIKAWAVYYFYTSIRALLSHNLSSSVSYIMGMGLIFLMALIYASQRFNAADRIKLQESWIAVGCITELLFLTGDRSSLGQYTSRTSLRIFGVVTDPNEFTSLFIITIPVAVYILLKSDNKIMKILSAVEGIIGLYCVFLGGSRGALLSIIFAVIFVVVQNTDISFKSIGGIAILCVIMFYVLTRVVLPMVAPDILNRITISSIMKDGGSGRSSLWLDALSTVWDGSVFKMLFGYGASGIIAGGGQGTSTMHNQFLQVLVDYGFVGLILYLYLLYRLLIQFVYKNKMYTPIFCGMVVMSLTITMGPQVKPFWVFIMTAFLGDSSLRRVNRNEESICYNY